MKRRWLRLAILVVALAVAALGLWRWAVSPPPWYRPPNSNDANVQAFADRVENRLLEEVQRVRTTGEGEAFTLRLYADQVNAWLAARLPRWLAHQGENWAEQVGTPQVRFERSGITVAAPLNPASWLGKTIVIQAMPTVMADGQLQVRLVQAGVGRLPGLLPGSASATRHALRLIAELHPSVSAADGSWSWDPVLDLADGRRVRIIGITLHQDAVDIAIQPLK